LPGIVVALTMMAGAWATLLMVGIGDDGVGQA